MKHKSNYDNHYYDANDFYIIDNSSALINSLRCKNYDSGRKTVSTYDFQTLYTHIPHDQLKVNLKIFVERVFGIRKKKYVCINKNQTAAFFSDKLQKKLTCFSIEGFIEALNFLIDNSFILYKGSLFRQVIGIPMGTNTTYG